MQVNAMLLKPEGPIVPGMIEIPDTAPDGVRKIEVLACGFCGTDGHLIDRSVPAIALKRGAPHIVPGHEVLGRDMSTGKLVIVPAVLCCGMCENCLSGRSNICKNMIMLGNTNNGGFAEYILVPGGHNLCVLPDDIADRINFPVEELCLVADALATPYHAVFNRACVKPGDLAVVIGCGGLGLNVCQMLKAAGAVVVGLDIDQTNADQALRFGADAVFCTQRDGNPEDVFKSIATDVKGALGGRPNFCFEVVGHPDAYNLGYKLRAAGGMLINIGYTTEMATVDIGRSMAMQLDSLGVWGCPPPDYWRVLHMAVTGMVKVHELVTGRFRLSEFDQAVQAQTEPGTIRSIVIPDRVWKK